MNVLIKPVISEKMTGISEKLHKYGFIVNKKANKIQIKKSVEEMYGVTVESVNTVIYAGKSKSRHTKKGFASGRADAFKKAFVTYGMPISFLRNEK